MEQDGEEKKKKQHKKKCIKLRVMKTVMKKNPETDEQSWPMHKVKDLTSSDDIVVNVNLEGKDVEMEL